MTNNNEIVEESAVTEADVTETEAVEAASEAETAVLSVEDELRAEIASLKEALAEAEKKAADNYDLALRTKAEAENARRRHETDLSNARKFGIEKFALDLLPVIDSMEMGLQAASDENVDISKIREGSEMSIKMFAASLEKAGAVAVDPQGEKFNPDLHQAMSMVENAELPPNTIINVVQKGYTLNGRLMRPAMVIVSKGGEAASPESGSIDEVV